MAEIKWNIRHYLKDGTELKPGMQFPDTPANKARLQRVMALCQQFNKGGEKHGKD